jgi:hypothetical protein
MRPCSDCAKAMPAEMKRNVKIVKTDKISFRRFLVSKFIKVSLKELKVLLLGYLTDFGHKSWISAANRAAFDFCKNKNHWDWSSNKENRDRRLSERDINIK